MKSKNTKFVLLFALLFLAISSFSVMGISFAKNSNDSFTFESSLKDTYSVGETVEIPEAKFGDKVADFVVYLPDGTATYSDSFVLTQNGNYTVDYSFITDDDRVIVDSLSFNVLTPMFSVKGDGYTEFRTLQNGSRGVYANLADGASLVYNGVIDLTKVAAEDLLFKFIMQPNVIGEADTNGLQITLTDAYDDDLFITMRFKTRFEGDSYDYTVTYIDCGFNGGDFIGLQRTTNGAYVYDGANYSYTKNHEKFGADFTFSMMGGRPNAPAYGFSGITYDENGGVLYAKTAAGYKVILTDVSNINLYGERFPGFTDGKVKLSVTPYNLIKTSCGVFFSEVGGQAVTEMNYNALTSDFYPEIEIDFGENENSIPNAKQGSVYRVFDASAFDIINGEVEVKTEVYFGYNNQNKMRINVTDSTFETNRVGDYTIVYTATNSFGNVTERLVNIKSVKDYEDLDISFENEIDYSLPVKAGQNIKLFDGYSVINNFGKAHLDVSIELLSDPDIIYELDDNFCFKPLYAGEYKITYTFADYIDSRSSEETLTVVANDIVQYEKIASVNKYFIKNGNYDVNVVKAYSLASGKPVEVPVKAYYIADDSIIETEIGEELTVLAEQNLTLVYRAQVGFDTLPYTIEVPVVNTGFGESAISKNNYFISTKGNANFIPEEKSIICQFLSSDKGVVSFDFVNVLARNTFSLSLESFLVDGKFNPFGQINVYLEDCVNSGNIVKFSVFSENGIWLACVNDGNPLKFKDSWGIEGDLLDFNYDVYKQTFSLNNELVFDVPCFYNSSIPVVFEKGINLTVEFVNVGTCKGVKINSINGQIFNESIYDTSSPTIDRAHDKNAGEKSLYSTVKVGGYYAFDVLSPNTQIYLTVSGPSGVLKSVDGVPLNKVDGTKIYEFKLNEYGNYSVRINYSDGFNDTTRSYTILVEDYTPPTVNITSKIENGKVGKSVDLAKFTVNLDASEYKYFFAIFDPNARITYTTDKTFVPSVSGNYNVHLCVFDANYNLTELVYTIIVK